jgi:hypothetical protein
VNPEAMPKRETLSVLAEVLLVVRALERYPSIEGDFDRQAAWLTHRLAAGATRRLARQAESAKARTTNS